MHACKKKEEKRLLTFHLHNLYQNKNKLTTRTLKLPSNVHFVRPPSKPSPPTARIKRDFSCGALDRIKIHNTGPKEEMPPPLTADLGLTGLYWQPRSTKVFLQDWAEC